ncbi:hypothetical protein Kpol_1039p7 [Vanderwaltozyma polyspora DSM 70294]|uniref:Acetyltransferase component of pyruvate dehydrogenase complex n=1 Tax=Vanderwaltozyma polyspora (strain ATCC 22028 / DSM 70294 / BCRC 21397 / CBS 2163 / NBRC 10782 / NRRL Y-8283 / UCD 57-17) TaxID=436907 RepID=A7THD4_VANPO|nr:uncharacterized protein Kpol_1039p7 [Vanderwaltozyma polyspora DSM 70294]EDO18258.1 hypothetical protein Kpol_1039p7 [Vanderwaltozyma polyspora DSM 70294]
MLRIVRSAPTITRCNLLRLYSSYPSYSIINMPALSPTMTHGNLASWTKKEGEQLSVGDVIAEVETDKATMDFEFQDDGYLAKILVNQGAKDVPVNKPIAIYVEDEADVQAFKDFKLPANESETAPTPADSTPAATPSASETVVEQQVAKQTTPSRQSAPATGTRILASPLAKAMALENGIALKNVTGTGPSGRIVKKDIEEYLKSGQGATSSVSAATTASTAAPAVAGGVSASASVNSTIAQMIAASNPYTDTEISNMRNIIGSRLLESTQTIPSYIVSSDISVTKLLRLRQSLNNDPANKNNDYKLSINDILVKAISLAVKRVPEVNTCWLEKENVIRQFENVDVSVAVATPTGLITPIVKNVNSKGLVSISNEVKDLVKRARINKLNPEEFQGGTICISNLGMNNAVSMFTSIINPPQSAILAVGTTKRIPVEDVTSKNGFTFNDVITITGTFDHRTIDGAKGGEFMHALKTIIENPLQLLL